jgi:predicted phosphoribosyltransferase
MIVEKPELRGKLGVFADRSQAGRILAGMMHEFVGARTVVLAIPAGGVPVGAALAKALGLNLDLAVVSKITLPMNSEAGFGAVAFDGTVRLNDELLDYLRLERADIERRVERTREKVLRREKELRGGKGPIELGGRDVILVDDGIASGYTILTAVDAVKASGAGKVFVATPTAHERALKELEACTQRIYCANIRGGFSFAVASAYRNWRDVGEAEAARIFERARA